MINEIVDADSSFSEKTFIDSVNHLFMMILKEIESNNINSIKEYLANDVYIYFNDMVNDYRNKNLRRKFDMINISDTKIIDSMITDNFVTIDVELTSSYKDYVIDNDNKCVNGSNDLVQNIVHKITLTERRKNKHFNTLKCNKYLITYIDGI